MWKATAVSLITLLAACGGATQPEPSLDVGSLPATVTLKVGQGRTVAGVVVRFAEVKADSRCPADVTCVWQGNAELGLVVGPKVGGGPPHAIVLNTGVEPHSGDALGLRFTVVNLSPEPASTTPTQGYQAEIRIERTPAR
mgnify:CR=1 FL=1